MKKYKNFLVGLFAIAIIAGSAYNFTLGKQDADRAANHSFSSATLNNIAKAAAEKEKNPNECRYLKMAIVDRDYYHPTFGTIFVVASCCVSGEYYQKCDYTQQTKPIGGTPYGPCGNFTGGTYWKPYPCIQ